MTPEQVAACQADLDATLQAEAPGARGVVCYVPAWTDKDGETYDGYWHAEVRRGRTVFSFDVDTHTRDRESWIEVLKLELDNNL